MNAPTHRSYWVIPGLLAGGALPSHPDPVARTELADRLHQAGIRTIVSLMERQERDHQGRPFAPYEEYRLSLPDTNVCRFPIPDLGIPLPETLEEALAFIAAEHAIGRAVYIHCWGGIGRTGTLVGIWLLRQGLATTETVLPLLARLRRHDAGAGSRRSPETEEQIRLVLRQVPTPPYSRTLRGLSGLWGAVIGDAVGVPFEFKPRSAVTPPATDALPGPGTHQQPPGTWSDDSSLLLCTVDGYASGGKQADIAQRFVEWKHHGLWTPHGSVFDIGIATAGAIAKLATGVDPQLAGGTTERSNGNGSLMRILPTALWHAEQEDAELIQAAHDISALTHRHPRSLMACGLFCLLAKRLVQGIAPESAWKEVQAAAFPLYQGAPWASETGHFSRLLSEDIRSRGPAELSGSGYVVHTLETAVWALLRSASPGEAVRLAISLGEDTDTTACVTGALAGLAWGWPALPAAWREGIVRRDDLAELFFRFIRQADTKKTG